MWNLEFVCLFGVDVVVLYDDLDLMLEEYFVEWGYGYKKFKFILDMVMFNVAVDA